MRFSAPADTTSVTISSGEVAVVDGFVDLPDDLTAHDVAGLVAHGFKAAHSDADLKRADKDRAAADKAREPEEAAKPAKPDKA